jgi:hypothetical protein
VRFLMPLTGNRMPACLQILMHKVGPSFAQPSSRIEVTPKARTCRNSWRLVPKSNQPPSDFWKMSRPRPRTPSIPGMDRDLIEDGHGRGGGVHVLERDAVKKRGRHTQHVYGQNWARHRKVSHPIPRTTLVLVRPTSLCRCLLTASV